MVVVQEQIRCGLTEVGWGREIEIKREREK